jgi:very-short-patch-repair endonuclease
VSASVDDSGDGPPPPLRGRSDREAIREGGKPQAHRPVAGLNRLHAKSMRSEMTDAERTLWMQLRAHRLDGLKFRRQTPIGRYIVDFVCHEHRLVIELDGGQHAESQHDTTRDRWLESKGYRILRFWNSDVFQNRGGVLETIVSAARGDALLAGPPPGKDDAMIATSPLEGEVDAAQQRRERGKPQAPAPVATPLPNPPPQGGRGRIALAGGLSS